MLNLIIKGPSTLSEVIGYEQQKSWQKHKKHRQNNDHGKNRVVMSGLFVYSAQWGQILYESLLKIHQQIPGFSMMATKKIESVDYLKKILKTRSFASIVYFTGY